MKARALRALPWIVAAAVAALYAFAISKLGVDPIETTFHGQRYVLVEPRWLTLFAIAPFLVVIAMRSWSDLPRAQVAVAMFLRLGALACLAVTAAHPARTTEHRRLSVVYVVDVSESVEDETLGRARTVVREARRLAGPEDTVRLVTFAKDAREVTLDEDDETLVSLVRHAGAGAGAETDLSQALSLAEGLLDPDAIGRIVVLSDGIETLGDARAEAARAAERGVTIHTRSLGRTVPEEVAVLSLDAPSDLRVGAPFRMRARVFSSRATPARVRLYQGDTLNALDPVRRIDLVEGEQDIELRSVVRVPGPVTYRVEIEPAGDDRFAENNRLERTLVVPGRPTVLYVEGARGRESYLSNALSAGEFEVEVRSARAIPTSVAELARFDFFILSDVAADEVSYAQMEAIEGYVRDHGGGFMMVGGERGFALGGWQGTRLERILPVRLDAERRRDQPTLALCLVIDRSGSMSGQKIELAKEAARSAASLLGLEDAIEVIGFDAEPERIVRMQSAGNRIAILRDIGRMAARGGTNIFPALDLAYQDLSVTRARIKHVILLTDGQSPEDGIEPLTQVMRADGITVSTVGLGADVNRTLLTQIATLGGGRSYFTNEATNVPRIFIRETTTVARSAVVEEYFQPRVASNADFLRGLDLGTSPFLHGYVATRARPAPAQVVLDTDIGEPLLARWRVGLGWSLAWTSDLKNRWAADFIGWSSYSRFISQMTREHMRRDRTERLPMETTIAGGEARISVDAIDGNDHFVNGLRSTVTLRRHGARNDREAAITAQLRQTAPGRYEARVPLDGYGAFVVQATHERDGRPVAESSGDVTYPYPGEYRRLTPDLTLLRDLAATSGGTFDGGDRAPFATPTRAIVALSPAWAFPLGLGVILYILDLVARRVRFDRERRTDPSTATA